MKTDVTPDAALNSLLWKVNLGQIEDYRYFQADVYRFTFPDGLGKDMTKQFTTYLQKLDMTELRSILKIYVWLYQHHVPFRLKFAWNWRCPFMHNLKSWFGSWQIVKLLRKCEHDKLMAYPLEGLESVPLQEVIDGPLKPVTLEEAMTNLTKEEDC